MKKLRHLLISAIFAIFLLVFPYIIQAETIVAKENSPGKTDNSVESFKRESKENLVNMDIIEQLFIQSGDDQEKFELLLSGCDFTNIEFSQLYSFLSRPVNIPEKYLNKAPNLEIRKLKCSDNIERPFIVGIPSINGTESFPLIIFLHGGVSWEEKNGEHLMEEAEENVFWKHAKEKKCFFLYPFAQDGATWWDKRGMENISRQIKILKKDFNIDDKRVWLGGVSDGGSGTFIQAMLKPQDYAACFSLIGHPGLGNIEGGLPTYLTNLSNIPSFVINTTDDNFYPSSRMIKILEVAKKCGADILFRELPGGHDTNFLLQESLKIIDFLESNVRNNFPSRINFETSDLDYGKFLWLKIESLDPFQRKDWHKENNAILPDEKVEMRWIIESDFSKGGASIKRIFIDTIPSALGLRSGDIIQKIDEVQITSKQVFDEIISKLRRGRDIQLDILRDGKSEKILSRFPQPVWKYVFQYDSPSGIVHAECIGNKIELKSSGVASLSIFVHPDQFDISRKISVYSSGEQVFNDYVYPDKSFMLRNFFRNYDKSLIYINKISLQIKSKPEPF
ncbi:MAG: PDZ domain-containing protein [Candidatus Riflebacteria bacterium]|nr:PDZ domain-containing protein [Candidatus Riflebacteria bacterium]